MRRFFDAKETLGVLDAFARSHACLGGCGGGGSRIYSGDTPIEVGQTDVIVFDSSGSETTCCVTITAGTISLPPR